MQKIFLQNITMYKFKSHFTTILERILVINFKDISLIEYELRLHIFQQLLFSIVFSIVTAALSFWIGSVSLLLLSIILFMMFVGVLGYRTLFCLLGKVCAVEGSCCHITDKSEKHSYIIIQVNEEMYVKIYVNPYNFQFHPKEGNVIRIYGEINALRKKTDDLYEFSSYYHAFIKRNYLPEKINSGN